MWHNAFNRCANLLERIAKWLDPYWPGGMDYVKINVILFCYVTPAVILASLGLNAVLLCRLF